MGSLRVPKYCHHKATGQARVRLRSGDIYLGKYDSSESRERYAALVAEYLAAPSVVEVSRTAKDDLTVVELLAAYYEYAESYYPETSSEPASFLEAVVQLRSLYGSIPADEFGPKRLKAVRQRMIDDGLCRTNINQRINRIRRAFKWAASEELVPTVVHQSLCTVGGLRAGYCDAKESKPVEPVPESDISAILPYLSPVVRAMVELQRLTAARPGEICILRPDDVDRSGDVWTYKPTRHKTQLRGKSRVIHIGPAGQDVLRPYLLRPGDAPCFSPAESEGWRLGRRAEARKTPLSCGNRPGTNWIPHPAKNPGAHYTTASYRQAIHRACRAAGVPKFGPHRIRHTAGTAVRAEFGVETARAVLGHAHVSTAELYAEMDAEKAANVARRLG